MPNTPWRNLVLLIATLLATLVFAELTLRVVVKRSTDCYGELIGVDLPPCRLPPPFEVPAATERAAPYQNLSIEGRAITVGDLWGIWRADPVLGYAPLDGSVSENEWWVTDEHGARIDVDLRHRKVPTGTDETTVLVFGDSFAVGSRLPYKEAWAYRLDKALPHVRVLNFGVDGYGMGQSYLRYKQVSESVAHDKVLLMFAPEDDLWRDVNVRRDIGEGWPLFSVMPRFVLESGALELIRSPFSSADVFDGTEEAEIGRQLKAHLRAYDRFYFSPIYERGGALDDFVVIKLVNAARKVTRQRNILRNIMNPDSEAVRVTAEIFRNMNAEVNASGRQFAVAVLPTRRSFLNKPPGFWKSWNALLEAVCGATIDCIDLSGTMRSLSPEELDFGYDGSHFGPVANEAIARSLLEQLLKPRISSETEAK